MEVAVRTMTSISFQQQKGHLTQQKTCQHCSVSINKKVKVWCTSQEYELKHSVAPLDTSYDYKSQLLIHILPTLYTTANHAPQVIEIVCT